MRRGYRWAGREYATLGEVKEVIRQEVDRHLQQITGEFVHTIAGDSWYPRRNVDITVKLKHY